MNRWIVSVLLLGVRSSTAQDKSPAPESAAPPKLDAMRAAVIRDRTPEEQRLPERELIEYLLREVQETPSVSGYNRDLEPLTPCTAERVGRRRLSFVRFRGRIEYLQEEALAEGACRGRVVIGDGLPQKRVVFVTPTLPVETPNVLQPQFVPIREGWIRGRGIYVKRFLDTGPDRKEVPAVLVVATKIERAFETRPVNSLDDVGLEVIDDNPDYVGTDKQRRLSVTYPIQLCRLLKYTETCNPDTLTKRKLEDIASILAKPSRARGQYYSGSGEIALKTWHVPPEACEANDAGVERYLTGWVLTDHKQLIQFAAPSRLVKRLEAGQRVCFEGFFYKLRAYTAGGGTTRLAAMFVLTTLEPARLRDS